MNTRILAALISSGSSVVGADLSVATLTGMSADTLPISKITVLGDAPACVGRVVAWANQTILQELRDEGIRAWIAGGAVRARVCAEDVKDVDLFFADDAHFSRANDWMLLNGATMVHESANATKWIKDGIRFDCVAIFGSSPEETIRQFDFTVCAAATDGKAFYLHPTFFADLASKQLVVQSLPMPISTLKRLQRYALAGYKADNNALGKIALAINALEVVDTSEFGPYVG